MKHAARTCAACREEGVRDDDLVRIALLPDGRPVVDYRARLGGRGAWLHPRAECVAVVAKKPGLLGRSLRADVPAFPVAEQLRTAVTTSAFDGLSLAAAAGALVGGYDQLESALAFGRVTEVVVACDASERTIAGLRKAAPEGTPFTVVPLDREALGQRTGQAARAALGVTPGGATVHLRRQLRRLRMLG